MIETKAVYCCGLVGKDDIEGDGGYFQARTIWNQHV